MKVLLEILRAEGPGKPSRLQRFEVSFEAGCTVADALRMLNAREPLLDADGAAAEPIGWSCSCLQKKCGACAMRINGRPQLACDCFLEELAGGTVRLEPLSKFPLVRDLIVDRSAVMDRLRTMRIWTQGEARNDPNTRELRYASSACLMCGCCLEICPNFASQREYTGAMGAVNAYRILENQEGAAQADAARAYRRLFYEGCGLSLACRDICPAGLPLDELMSRANGIALWPRHRKR